MSYNNNYCSFIFFFFFLFHSGIPCFGPTAVAAEIEASKDFSKKFMVRHGIPTARFEAFTDSEAACKYILRCVECFIVYSPAQSI